MSSGRALRAQRVAAVFGAVILLLVPALARAEAVRAAVIVGNDVGRDDESPLRYAEEDAERMARLLGQLAGFARENTWLLNGRSAEAVRQALAAAAARLKQTPGDHLFFFYYSGHADAQALHLGNDSLGLAELKAKVLELSAGARVLILDACQSGALTRVKGGRPGPVFEASSGPAPRGLAILASASDTEFAQESDELRGSFFSYHLQTGLRGMADRDKNGRVSLTESFDYASERTLDATLASSVGPQHPTFRYDLVGREDLVLTYPGLAIGHGRLHFDRAGWYFVRQRQGRMMAEVRSRGGEDIALEPGHYELSRRGDDQLETASVQIAPGRRIPVSSLPTRRVAYGQFVRKGGGDRTVAFAASLGGVVRSSLLELGPATGAGLWMRADAPPGSLELRGSWVRSSSSTQISAQTSELTLSLAALRAWDVSVLTAAVGLEAGWSLFRQDVGPEESNVVHAPMFGPTALLELPWGPRFCVRADVGLPIYALALETEAGDRVKWSLGLRAGLGAGGYF